MYLLLAASFRPFVLSMFATACDPFVVTLHAIDALACLCENELFDLCVAGAAGETGSVIGLVASHDGLLHDRQVADVAGIIALAANWMAVREKEDVVTLCADSVLALCASEALDVPELGRELNDAFLNAFLVNETAATSAIRLWQFVLAVVQVSGIGLAGGHASEVPI